MDRQIKVLLIDDQPMIGEAIRRMLLSEPDITFHYYSDPVEALNSIAELEPTVILQDLVMPDIDGLLLVRFLRAKNSPSTDIPLVVLSGKEEPIIKAKAFQYGANDYLVKLPDPIELIARIRYHSKAYMTLLKLHEAQEMLKAENLRLSAELDVTRRLQQMILPKPSELSEIEQLDIAGFMQPADEVGGDYYDVLSDGNNIKIGIGDVTGHGLESGVLMLMVQTAIRTLLEHQETDPVKFMGTVNRTIYKNVQRMSSDKNLTLAILDYDDGNITISGQHEEVLLVRADASIEHIDTMELGFPVGLIDEITDYVFPKQIQLNPGDGIVLYTDGITEAENLAKEFYGLERLCEVISQNWHLSAIEIKEALIADLQDYIGEQTIFDDTTLVILKQK